jgi:hypothetical protein
MKKLEAGVSVYEGYADGPHWRYIESRAIEKNEPSLAWTPWFLVSGKVQPTAGGDGEPLLKAVTIVNSLQWDRVQKRFAVLAAPVGASQRKLHPGHGTSTGCTCT